jgi:hypothetical protein
MSFVNYVWDLRVKVKIWNSPSSSKEFYPEYLGIGSYPINHGIMCLLVWNQLKS